MNRVARHVRVAGRVQGVFFRAWTKGQADALGVSGWVRNCDDGSVEAHVQGDEAAVDALVAAMREGPRGAHVAQLNAEPIATDDAEGFAIRH